MSTNFKRRVVGKTADYTISLLRDQADTVFTNRGAAGAVVLTLPPPAYNYLGVRYYAKGVVDFGIGFAGTTAGDLVTKNDAAANSVKAQTAGELLGATLEAECIETVSGTYKWEVIGVAVGITYTVAT